MGKTTQNSNNFACSEPHLVLSGFIHETRHKLPEIPIPS